MIYGVKQVITVFLKIIIIYVNTLNVISIFESVIQIELLNSR